METTNNGKSGLERLSVFIPVSVFLVFAFVLLYNTINLEFFGKETTGIVTGFTENAKGNPFVEYSFNVNGEKFTGKTLFGNRLGPKIGEKYVVIYSEFDHSVSTMELSRKVK